MERKIEILYEDQDIAVCVKPPGTATETKRAGQQDMVSLMRNYRCNKGEEPYAGLVHRLDQPVEGILVFGKHVKSTSELSRQLARGGFSKVYLAVTEGNMPENEGRLLDYLKKDGRSNTSAVADKGDPQAKRAELLYRVLETDNGREPVQNLVRIQLLTGRHHQIRVQMAHLGTPLAGDMKYGKQNESLGNGTWCHKDLKSETLRIGGGLGLCACELEFLHPVTNKALKFQIIPSQPVFRKFGNSLEVLQ